jgi:hypothetical protein
VASISGGALAAMSQLSDLQSDEWEKQELEARIRGELRGLIGNYIAHLLGHRPKMHAFLQA